jgi:pSer/pThr/pTyr-binding forkhead associated (FHA) protein
MKNVEEDMGTTVLTASTMVERHPYLYQVKNGTKLYLTKKTNRIGKNREVADICIEGNPAISRCHAIIYQIEDTCYVEDLNSTNGTYVDDRQITSNNKTALRVGSRLKLADEEFELRYD